jgi:hypothetical protein
MVWKQLNTMQRRSFWLFQKLCFRGSCSIPLAGRVE